MNNGAQRVTHVGWGSAKMEKEEVWRGMAMGLVPVL
jgi:hypothetical protein